VGFGLFLIGLGGFFVWARKGVSEAYAPTREDSCSCANQNVACLHQSDAI